LRQPANFSNSHESRSEPSREVSPTGAMNSGAVERGMPTRLALVGSLGLVVVGLALASAATIALTHDGLIYLGSFKRDCGSLDAFDLAAATLRIFSMFALGAGLCATATGIVAIVVPRFARPLLIASAVAVALLALAARVFVQSPDCVVAASKAIC
jgi:hypothetical protein